MSVELFNNINATGFSETPETQSDILLFQYGTYNWGDDKDNHTNFDITRQFIVCDDVEDDDTEFYQLSFSLIYDPTILVSTDSYNSWISDFKDLQDWVTNIKSTNGYHQLKSSVHKSYDIFLMRM